jgi:uncharacterized protein YbjT (DUF2867 family)
MKVIVFGATGTIGKHLIEQSLEKGYQVSAFSRNADKLKDITSPNLTIIEGDVLNAKDVKDAVKGHDAVCIALGSGKSRDSVIRSQGTKIIIEAMKLNSVKRLTCQSTLGAGDSNKHLNFFWKNIMFGWFLKKVYLDHELQEEYVRNSGLDWTLIRAAAFTDGEKTGTYLHGFSSTIKKLKLKISRADVADFTLKQLQSDKYLHQAPGLSY